MKSSEKPKPLSKLYPDPTRGTLGGYSVANKPSTTRDFVEPQATPNQFWPLLAVSLIVSAFGSLLALATWTLVPQILGIATFYDVGAGVSPALLAALVVFPLVFAALVATLKAMDIRNPYMKSLSAIMLFVGLILGTTGIRRVIHDNWGSAANLLYALAVLLGILSLPIIDFFEQRQSGSRVPIGITLAVGAMTFIAGFTIWSVAG